MTDNGKDVITIECLADENDRVTRTLRCGDGPVETLAPQNSKWEPGAPEAGDEILDRLINRLLRIAGIDETAVVDVNSEWHDCECCGSFADEIVSVSVGERQVARFVRDGHFGGGDDIDDPDAMAIKAMEELGRKVIVSDGDEA